MKVYLYVCLNHQNRLTHSMFVSPHENAVRSAPPEYKTHIYPTAQLNALKFDPDLDCSPPRQPQQDAQARAAREAERETREAAQAAQAAQTARAAQAAQAAQTAQEELEVREDHAA